LRWQTIRKLSLETPLQSEPLHELGCYPTDADLLQAARSALRVTLAARISDAQRSAAVRQLDAILRELLHRAEDFPALIRDRAALGRRLVRDVRLLERRMRRRTRSICGLDSRRDLPGRSPRAAYSAITSELCAALPALWDHYRAQPSRSARRELDALTRRVVAWESGTACALAADPPNRSRTRVKRDSAPTLGAMTALMRRLRLGAKDVRVVAVKPLSGGFSRATWSLETRSKSAGPGSYVVRQQKRGGIVQGLAADVRHEFPLLQVLHGAGVPVPAPLLLVTGASPLGHDFIVVEHLPGQAVGNSVGESTSADEMVLRSAAQALARLHSIDWRDHHAALKGSRVWHPSKNVRLKRVVNQLLERWARYIRRNIGLASPSVATGLAWLRANVPDRNLPPRIVHGDITFANMLVYDGRVNALLDWEVACLGDPAKDLAHFKPVVEARMRWQDFMASYLAAGGDQVGAETLQYYEVFKAVTHVAVTYVARGHRFSQAPAARPELTEIGLLQPAFYMKELESALAT
jgi:aminoglycoside phosphotransferase (APT) family kinase protein